MRRMTRRRLARLVLLAVSLVVGVYAFKVFAGWNEHAVIDGVFYRSAQMSGPRLAEVIREKRIRTVLNLRGTAQQVHAERVKWYRDEVNVTHAANVSQEDVTLSAGMLPPPAELRRAIDVLDRAEPPVLLHCKQGADRTGLIAAVARLLYTDDTLEQARRQLWPVYGHFPVGRTVAMDEFLDRYEAWLGTRNEPHTPARFREWALTVYTPGPASSHLVWLTPAPTTARVGKSFVLKLRATNTSTEPWEFRPGNYAGIHLLYKVAPDPDTEAYRGQAGLFRRTVGPGESVDLDLPVPALRKPGRYTVVAELIDARGSGVSIRTSSFVKFGAEPILAQVVVE